MGENALKAARQRVNRSYHQYVADYKQYLWLRGFGDHLHDAHFVQRGFLECWFEPGFHRFWQVWNPGIAYFTYRLYLWLGGRERQGLATMAVFLLNGIFHNVIVSLLLQRWAFPLPFTFLSFGVFTVIFRWLDIYFPLARLPRICHFMINVGLVVLSFEFGFYMNGRLVRWIIPCNGEI